MDQNEHNENLGTWLRRAWTAALRIADAMATGRSPVEQLFDRIDRLEREVAAMSKAGATEIRCTRA